MAPTPGSSAMAYIKQCKPTLRGEVSKMAYLLHTYAVLSDCTLIGMDERPGDPGAVEMEMPAELDKQEFASLHYRTHPGLMVEIAILRADKELLVHWASHSVEAAGESPPIHSTAVPLGKYFTGSDLGADAYERELVPELMDKFTAGLDIMFQAKPPESALSQGAQPAQQNSGDCGRSKPRPDNPARPDQMAAPAPLPMQPVHGFRPDPSPLMDGVPMHGGSHVGPDDPMFAGLVRGHGFRTARYPPGARFDPIAPDGLPGSHPDDFVGPGQADGWHDLGPPPGRNVPGRRGPGNDPFGGFM
eukprot:jgi/Ulvmu1/7034/UM033_0093.1